LERLAHVPGVLLRPFETNIGPVGRKHVFVGPGARQVFLRARMGVDATVTLVY
jgi:hypothetical protein